MKHQPKKDQKAPGNSHTVRFEVAALPAREVFVAGTFNDWQPAVTPMLDLGEGRWAKDIVLPPGTYEYLFVADGEWLPDPGASECVPNPFGGINCLIVVSGDN